MPKKKQTFESELSAALQAEKGEVGPDCLDPERLISLIENGKDCPNSLQLFAHIAGCPVCRRSYVAMEEDLRIARRVRATRNDEPPHPQSSRQRWSARQGGIGRLAEQAVRAGAVGCFASSTSSGPDKSLR